MSDLQYFAEPHAADVKINLEPAPPFRSMRTGDLDVSLELRDEIGITVELSRTFSVARRTGGRTGSGVGAFGNVTIDPPGRALDLSVRGDCRIVQLALPLPLLVAMVTEDHEVDASGYDLHA